MTKPTQVVRGQIHLPLYVKNSMVAFGKAEMLTGSSEAMLSFSKAGWHHLQSRDNRQRKVLSFHYVFYPQAQSVA